MQKHLLKTVFQRFEQGGFTVRFWDGEEVTYGNEPPVVTLVFNEPLPASFPVNDLVLGFGEAYMDEIVDVEGSVKDVFLLFVRNEGNMEGSGLTSTVAKVISTVGSGVTSKNQQKSNVQHHYDLGNDFFSLWLDETLSYSCAYFRNEDDTLKQAQLNKIDHILKKLQLQPGQRLLDIGTGWGWLLVRAAQQYDVEAVGITLSEEQYEGASQMIRDMGLTDQVEVRLQDYLDLEPTELFDRVVSVGMFEHVGRGNHSMYMEKVRDLLLPGGLSLLHSIMGLRETGVNTWIEKYIFPGGYIPSVRETVALLPDYGFHLIHAESLRRHYAKTLDQWYANFAEHKDVVEEKFGRRFVRMWELYLLSCAASFRTTGLDVYQMLFSKGLNNKLEMTLDHVYAK